MTKKETIIRTAVLAIALINQILSSTGHSIIPIESEQLEEIISLVLTVGASLWAWWKNNSFTWAAIEADSYMKVLKENDKNVTDKI